MNLKRLTIVSLLCLFFIPCWGQMLTSIPSIPKGHPRVYILPSDIPNLKKKINEPEFFKIKNTVYSSSQSTLQAFRYLLDGKKSDGLEAITSALSSLTNMNAKTDGRIEVQRAN